MASLRALQKRGKRTRIYEAAIRLFRERGYDGVTVDEIVASAGTSKGTFFNYFPTKDHVLAEYHDRMTGWILGRVEGREFQGCEEAVTSCVMICADWVEKDPPIGQMMVRRIFASPILLEADLKNSKRFVTWFAQRVDRGIATGELKADVDRGTLLSMIAAVLSSTMTTWALGVEIELRDALRRRIAFVFDAARAAA